MLAAILVGIYSFILLVLYGAGFLAIASHLFSMETEHPPTLVQTALAGFLPLVFLTSLLSIFMPIDSTAAILLLVGGILLAIWLNAKCRSWINTWVVGFQALSPLTWLTAGIALITTLILATLKPGNSDTGLYHAQAIRWIVTFPAVPGLGNLHSRLAYNSNWFPLQAGFSFAFLDLRSFHLMGAVLTALCLAWFTGGLRELFNGRKHMSAWMKTAFIPLTFYVLASEISSTGTDLPVTLFTWVILSLWVETREDPHGEWDWRHVLLITLPVMLISIKLSAFPLLLVTVWQLVSRIRSKNGIRRLVMTIIFVLVLWAPWLSRNVIISGYLAYPQTVLDVFDVPWKMPLKSVQDEAEWIVAWARFPRTDKDVVLAMPVTQWAPMWFDDLSRNRQLILLILAAAPFGFGLTALASFSIFRKRVKGWFRYFSLTWPVWLVTYVGILFWFFSVPRYRFGNGVLMTGLVLIVICAISLFRDVLKPFTRIAPYAAVCLISVYSVFVLVNSADPKTLTDRLLLPANYVNLPTEPCRFGNFSVYCATQYQQCGYNPFPCVPQSIPDVYMRGSSFGDGFEIR